MCVAAGAGYWITRTVWTLERRCWPPVRDRFGTPAAEPSEEMFWAGEPPVSFGDVGLAAPVPAAWAAASPLDLACFGAAWGRPEGVGQASTGAVLARSAGIGLGRSNGNTGLLPGSLAGSHRPQPLDVRPSLRVLTVLLTCAYQWDCKPHRMVCGGAPHWDGTARQFGAVTPYGFLPYCDMSPDIR